MLGQSIDIRFGVICHSVSSLSKSLNLSYPSLYSPSLSSSQNRLCGDSRVPPKPSTAAHTNINLAARCERAERFSFIAQIIITQFYFYEAAIPLPQPLFPPPWQATTYLYHTNNELSMFPPDPPHIFSVPPDSPWPPPPGSLACHAGGGGGRSHDFRLLELENAARVNHFAFLLL